MATIYQFGKFVLNVREQSLTVGGEPVHLPTKEFETLQLLVENNGKVLSKDEMMATIWKETFVEESNLAQYISRLRKILEADGTRYIKTISKRGYRFSAEVRTLDDDLVIERHLRIEVGGDTTRTLDDINSVAVLPFIALADPTGDDFFGLGIADALITQLTRSGQIITRPTTSVLGFKSPDRSLTSIAKLLDVDAILEGNFQRSGDRLRLTAQMFDSLTGKTLWAESFNTEIEDIFAVQDRIAERIVRSLSKGSSSADKEFTKHYTESKTAYEEYLKGRFSFSQRNTSGLFQALRHFEKAIEFDPCYALAYAGIAETYQRLPLADGLDPHTAFPRAKAAALRALELDDLIPEAHVALGVIMMDFDWNWSGAELSFQKAIELNPNYAAAHQVYGTLLLRLGRIGDAIIELRKAQVLDPLSPAINTWMAEAFAQLGEHEAAIRIHRETIAFAPDYLFAHYFLVQSYVSTGRVAEAEQAAAHAIKLSDDMSLTRSASIFLKAHIGDTAGARSELNELVGKRESKYVSAINIASGFAVLNETADVYKWLEIAYDERDSNLTWLNVDREFDYLRHEARFQAIVRKVGLPEGSTNRSVNNIDKAEQAENGGMSRLSLHQKVAAAAVVAALLLGSAGYYFRSSLAGYASARERQKNVMVRLTEAPFRDGNPMFGPDGRIRFLRFFDRQTIGLLEMNADGTDVRPASNIPGLTSGLYSPDGTKIFFHKSASDPAFYLANSDGTDERQMPFRPGNCSWSRDSKHLVYQTKSEKSSIPNNSDIFIYSLETGTITPVVESDFYDSDPAFSPDGKSIAYVSDADGNFEIYSRVIATGETRRLTHNMGHDSFPTYSPDGTQIIFNSDMEKENNDVYLMNADGGNLRKITDGPGWDAAPPNGWSADGTQILLLSDIDAKESVYVMDIEPYVPRRIAPNIESDGRLFPAYSPVGDQIVFVLDNDIRILDLATGTDRFVFRTSEGALPSFSPDARRILFQNRPDENTEVGIVNVDGTGYANLTQHPARDISPSFSPDGSKVAFAASRASGTTIFELYVMNADGSEPEMVFGDRAISSGPSWSPDGKTIVFSNDREDGRVGNFELFSLDLASGAVRRLTNRPRYDADAAISPDGTKIAFTSNTDGNAEIYVMNADGSGLLRLTRDLGSDLYPRWSPDGKKLLFVSDRTGKYGMYEIEL